MRTFQSCTPGPVSKRDLQLLPPAIAFVLLVLWAPSSAAGVSASADKTAIALGETVRLTLETTGDLGGYPDLSALATDFEIVDRRTSHNVAVVNGKRAERHLLTLRLLPRRAGELTIPAIPVGDAATEPLQLSVVASAARTTEAAATPPPGAAVVVEADLEPRRVYTSQQLILTVKVFMDGPVQRPRLHDPQIRDAEFLPLGEDRYEAQRGGQSYRVYERRYAIFPRAPGRMEIDPLLFEGWAPTNGGSQSGMGYAVPERPVRARSPALATSVLSPAAGTDPEAWLPARSLALSETGPETYRTFAGQRVERHISLRAEGVMAHKLPQLTLDLPHQLTTSPGQTRMWDERRPEGVIGTRREVVALTAEDPGHYRLPPLRIDWWNTAADKWETAMLPARELVVSAGPTTDAASPQLATAIHPEPRAQTAEPGRMQMTQYTPAAAPEAGRDESSESGGLWAWIAAALGLAWIATAIGWWRSRCPRVETAAAARPAEAPATSEQTDPLQSEIDAVRTAYEAGDAGAAREALLAWAQRALPGQPPSNLARLAQRCAEPLRGQVLLLEEAFFSPSPVAWEQQAIWDGLRRFVPTPPEEPASFRRGKRIKRRRAPKPDAP